MCTEITATFKLKVNMVGTYVYLHTTPRKAVDCNVIRPFRAIVTQFHAKQKNSVTHLSVNTFANQTQVLTNMAENNPD